MPAILAELFFKQTGGGVRVYKVVVEPG